MKNQKTPNISRIAAVAVTALMCSAGEANATAEASQAQELNVIQQIERYCSKSWRTAHIPREEWDDSTQQVLTEMLERVSRDRLSDAITASNSEERRELNRSIWRIAKRWVRRHRHNSLGDFDAPGASPKDSRIDDQIEKVLDIASAKLTDKQGSIIRLLKEGFSVSEIASELQMPASRVSNEKHRAIKQIRRYLCDVA